MLMQLNTGHEQSTKCPSIDFRSRSMLKWSDVSMNWFY